MSAPKRRPRTAERERKRAHEKLVRAREKLLDLAPGGARSHPIDVPTASVIEPQAKSLGCPRCDGPFQVEGHDAVTDERHGRLREAKLRCPICGAGRSLWFRIVTAS